MSVNAKVKQVIEVVFTRGTGTEEDPVRYVTAYHEFDGSLLAESDPEAGGAHARDTVQCLRTSVRDLKSVNYDLRSLLNESNGKLAIAEERAKRLENARAADRVNQGLRNARRRKKP